MVICKCKRWDETVLKIGRSCLQLSSCGVVTALGRGRGRVSDDAARSRFFRFPRASCIDRPRQTAQTQQANLFFSIAWHRDAAEPQLSTRLNPKFNHELIGSFQSREHNLLARERTSQQFIRCRCR